MDYENLTPQYRIEEYLEAIVKGYAEATQYPYPDYPSWRIEEFLDAFITYIWEDESHPRHPCPEPAWRLEECLRAIYDVMTGAATPWPFPTPTNRIEEYLAAIHAYLADGTELPVPEPVWRIEQWLAYVLDGVKQGGGGGTETTVTGTLPLTLANALSHAIVSLTRYGLCTQAATPTPDAPVDIMCNNGALKWDSVNQRVYADGTPEVLTVGGPNLLNTATNVTGYFINGSGVINQDSGTPSSQYTDLIPVEAGKKYTLSLISNRTKSGNNRVHGYDSNGNWVQEIIRAAPTIGSDVPFKLTTYTIQEGIVYVRISYGINDVEAMYEVGDTQTDYQPYVAPQTASVPSLFALDNRKDEADIISGAVTRQTGIKVLDGTENWVDMSSLNFFTVYGYLDSYTPTPTKAPQNFMPLSTHFSRKSGAITPRLDTVGADLRFYYSEEFSDLATWKAWLAAQYAAGTPVIIVYKIDGTEVTEQVPEQHLVTNEGTNIVDSVANVSPLTAEVKYMKGGNEA